MTWFYPLDRPRFPVPDLRDQPLHTPGGGFGLQEVARIDLHAVNAAMVAAYWHVGREIVEEEQRGRERAEYGVRLIKELSKQLTAQFGKGFSVSNLKLIRQFYLTYQNHSPQIGYTVSSQLAPTSLTPAPLAAETSQGADSVAREPGRFLRPDLSWSHYRILMRVDKPEARSFYEVECSKARWSVRELERQIGSVLYERLALSRDKEGVLALAEQGHEIQKPEDLIKDPYVLEFTGLPEAARWQEGDLETALIDRLQQFLLELGRDLFFVARQKRITMDFPRRRSWRGSCGGSAKRSRASAPMTSDRGRSGEAAARASEVSGEATGGVTG